MAFNFKKFLDKVDSTIESTVSSAVEYTKKEVLPEVRSATSSISERVDGLVGSAKEQFSNIAEQTTKKIEDWSGKGKADNIPAKYHGIVKNALIAASAAGPLGVVSGPADTIAIAGIWSTMFFSIRNKSGKSFGNDPSRITSGVAAGIVKYYIGCKLASYACFLIPGAGVFAGMSLSTLCNIYFTYNFASILIELMDTKSEYSDDDIIREIISLLKKTPTVEEVKEIVQIYSN